MPERLRDPAFDDHFDLDIDEIDPGSATARCKSCPASWDVLVNGNGTVPLGPRNSLLAHAARHSPQFKPKLRRRS